MLSQREVDEYYRYRAQVEKNIRKASLRKIRRDSFAEGYAEGLEQGQRELVKRMLAEHLPEDTIVRISGLSIAEVQQIRDELS